MSADAGGDSCKCIAFFDVDGTLVKSTIVHYYMYFRRKRMGPLKGLLWEAAYRIKCVYYLVLDKIDRSLLNRVFYRDYRGLSAEEIKGWADCCYQEMIAPRCFLESAPCVEAHRQAGLGIVLVTGSIDFIVEPLARQLQADHVVAPTLVELNGRFTGELDGPPVGDQEKARRIRRLAEEHNVDLDGSYAYGDSIADLPMLETVGNPQAVNPDRALASIARRRGWPIHRWGVAGSKGNDGP